MKISNKALATFYNITHATLLNYKSIKMLGIEEDMKQFYIKFMEGGK